MSKHRHQTILPSHQRQGYRLIVIGLILLIAAFSFRLYQKWQEYILSFAQVPPLTVTQSSEIPQRITIPKIHLNLAVTPGQISNGVWQVSLTTASYLVGSGEIGQPGNAIIYGHNKNSIFGPIRWLVVGDEITIIGQNNKYNYRVIATNTVNPDSIDLLLPTTTSTLTLYTCTGLFDRQRFVITAIMNN